MKTKRNFNKNFFDLLGNCPEWNILEYIYIDENINIEKIADTLLENKIVITPFNNKLCMFDSSYPNQLRKSHTTALNYTPIVDLIIISKENDLKNNQIKKLIDKHTIISKIISDDVFYIKDAQKKLLLLVINDNIYKFKGEGIGLSLLDANA